jgi:hypothetical protein
MSDRPTPFKSSRDRRETTTQSDRRTADLNAAPHAALEWRRDPESLQVERDRRPEPSTATPPIRRIASRDLLQFGEHSPGSAAVRKESCAPSAVVTKDSSR